MTEKKIFEIPLYPYQRSSDQDAEKPVRHPVVIAGAGPVGLACAIDLAQQGVRVLVLDDNDKVSWGSRAICFAKRPLEILDRLGCGDEFVKKGVTWNVGKVFFDQEEVYHFNLLAEDGHKRPAFINLQQYYLEEFLLNRLRQLQAEGKPVELRGRNKVSRVQNRKTHVLLTIETPEGAYEIEADWLIACDGANSPIRDQLDLEFVGKVFEDNFLIADVIMQADFPRQRWFWFDPPFNRGQSALLHKQPDNLWRIDLQLGWDIDKEEEKKSENVIPRIKQMLGEDVEFELEWVSIYTFQCKRMKNFRHGHILFAGDAAHQVSPFGARGANSGLQDTDNLCWKLKLVLEGKAPETLLDSYDQERVLAADENILNSTRSTDFITPKSDISRTFRNAVLDLARQFEFARPLVNSGRLSLPAVYDGCRLNGPDHAQMPGRTRPGAPAVDAPINANGQQSGWLIDQLGDRFQILAINTEAPDDVVIDGLELETIRLESNDEVRARYLGETDKAVYLLRPDQHVVGRWTAFDLTAVQEALRRAIGKPDDETTI